MKHGIAGLRGTLSSGNRRREHFKCYSPGSGSYANIPAEVVESHLDRVSRGVVKIIRKIYHVLKVEGISV